MRREDKERRAREQGVWIQLTRDGNVIVVPVKLSQGAALNAIIEIAQAIAETEGMTLQ